jgi:8-oxo-dGTP diphosphatase
MASSQAEGPPTPLPLVLVVAAAVFRRGAGAPSSNGKAAVLLAQRPEGKAMAGLWEFPGGKVEPTDPSPEHALARELREELGLGGGGGGAGQAAAASDDDAALARRLSPLAFASHSYERFHLLMPLYALELGEEEEEQPRGMEGQALVWATADDLEAAEWAMPPADDPLVAPVVGVLRRMEREQQGMAAGKRR